MTPRNEASCDTCYFRRAGLCALVLSEPCPTFRRHTRAGLEPPRHPSLLPLAVPLAAGHAVYAA